MRKSGHHNSRRKTDARSSAYEILKKFMRDKERLDDLFDQHLQQSLMNSRSRRMLRNLTSGVVRHWLYLDWLAGKLFEGNYQKALIKEKVILYLGLYELIFLKGIPPHATLFEYVELAKSRLGEPTSRRVNAIFQSYLREKAGLIPEKFITDASELISIKYSFPDWLVKRWIGLWGKEETERLCGSLNVIPEFDITIHEDRIQIEKFHSLLAQNGIEFQQSDKWANVITTRDMQSIIGLDLLEKGYCSVQDESTAIPVHQLKLEGNGPVLDICAAPGGKYLRILGERTGKPAMTVAVDVDLKRLRKVNMNVRRLGLKGGLYVAADGRHLPFKPVFERVLVDAPCTGLGVIRKHPDIKWRRSMHEIIEFSHIQEDILQSASSVVMEGGRLVYSTCTLDPLENENVATAFSKANHDKFQPAENVPQTGVDQADGFIRTFPHRHQTDGTFCAVFQKIKKESC